MERLLIILDLDETLVHVPDRPLARDPDFLACGYGVHKRPHVDAFLARLFASYRVAIWTASGDIYATAVVSQLLPDPAQLEFLWCSERCTERFDHETRHRTTIKPLSKVRRRGYDLERVLVVDDSPEKHVLNYGNLIHVLPFEGDMTDDELPRLLAYIDKLSVEPNMRCIEKRHWRTESNAILDASLIR
ncbi:phosphoprotein phosphatase [Minicystis rosea]|nr:phosphoprotein phosphatase [Minicystis rosea]